MNIELSSPRDDVSEMLIDSSWVGDLEAVRSLVENKADVTVENNRSFRCAASNGHLETAKFLVENKADITVENNYSLCEASRNGHLEVVKFLIENKADITTRNNRAVRFASHFEHLETVKFLLSKGADFNKLTSKHKTYFRTLKWFRRWRKAIFLRRLTQVALPLYYSPGFPGALKGKKELEKIIHKSK